MSDARSKLNEALANAANKRKSGPSAPTQKPAPKPPARTPKAPPPAKASAPKPKPAKKKPPKPKKTGPKAPSAMMKSLSKFANNMMDELKTATSEISPAALISTASDSIQSIKKAVGLNDLPHTQDTESSQSKTQENTENTPEASPESPKERAVSSFSSDEEIPSSNGVAPSETAEASPAPGPMTSPAKVQRMPSKKKKNAEAPATEEAEPSQEDLLNQLTSDSVPAEPPASETASPSSETGIETPAPTTSPAKVVRAPSKKKKTEETPDETIGADEETAELPADDAERTPEADPETPDQESQTQDTDISPADDDAPSAPETPEPTASGGSTSSGPTPSGKTKKPAPKPQAAAISKTEHAVRSFQALQNVLTNPMWGPIITDPEIKPSTLYAPRETFDTNFSDPTFRAGLKAASRLASSFGIEPEKMRFNANLIEKVKSVNIDPEGKIKSHTENISGAIGEDKVKEIMGIYHNKSFKHLLFSVSTRMGSFVPTIESLARIYLSLRKKEPLTSSARLQIQEEILMRYRKAPYTDEMGKKARNLAMNYFMDYLSSYAIKLYKERFKDAPDGQNNAESNQRRHATIKTFCCGMIEEWGKKIALATPTISTMQAKFIDLADQHLEEVLDAGDSQ